MKPITLYGSPVELGLILIFFRAVRGGRFMRYQTENEILTVVHSFENGTISREKWRHAEHLTVALYYLSNHDYETALEKMRGGIFNLLRAFGVDLNKEMPYHETLTVFWVQTVNDFRKTKNAHSIVELSNEIVERFDKDYPLEFYSPELLFSERARIEFVEHD